MIIKVKNLVSVLLISSLIVSGILGSQGSYSNAHNLVKRIFVAWTGTGITAFATQSCLKYRAKQHQAKQNSGRAKQLLRTARVARGIGYFSMIPLISTISEIGLVSYGASCEDEKIIIAGQLIGLPVAWMVVRPALMIDEKYKKEDASAASKSREKE